MKKMFLFLVACLFACSDGTTDVVTVGDSGVTIYECAWDPTPEAADTDAGAPPSDEVEEKQASGSKLPKYMGWRVGGTAASACFEGAGNHKCQVPNNTKIKYTFKPAPGYIDSPALAQVRVGLEAGLGEISTLSGGNVVFSPAGGDVTIEFRYYNDPVSGKYGEARSQFLGQKQENIAAPITAGINPDVGIEVTKPLWLDFNTYAIRALAETCFGSGGTTNAEYQRAGKAVGIHEGMHLLQFMHTIGGAGDVGNNIMHESMSCSTFGAGAQESLSAGQVAAVTQYRNANWNNTTVLSLGVQQ